VIRVGRVWGAWGAVVGVLVAVTLAGCGAEAEATPGGYIPDGERVSPFDTTHPAIRKLDPALLDAVKTAATDARADGVDIGVTSGWRSKAYQQQLLDEAVAEYGSDTEARRFVSTPEESEHVTGHAVDIGPTDAADWLIQHGADYGLCQPYANEMWHFELLTSPGGACPPARPDAAG